MRLLRSSFVLLGFGVLTVLSTIEYTLSRRGGASTQPKSAELNSASASDADWVTAASVPPPSAMAARLRLLLGAVGALVMAYGAYVMVSVLPLASYLGLAAWLVGAIVLHDAVLVPAVSLLRVGAHRAGRRLPATAIRLIEAAFFLAGSITLLALPEIYAQHLGSNNPTVLPSPYGWALLATWLVALVVTGTAAALLSLHARRYRPGAARRDAL